MREIIIRASYDHISIRNAPAGLAWLECSDGEHVERVIVDYEGEAHAASDPPEYRARWNPDGTAADLT